MSINTASRIMDCGLARQVIHYAHHEYQLFMSQISVSDKYMVPMTTFPTFRVLLTDRLHIQVPHVLFTHCIIFAIITRFIETDDCDTYVVGLQSSNVDYFSLHTLIRQIDDTQYN